MAGGGQHGSGTTADRGIGAASAAVGSWGGSTSPDPYRIITAPWPTGSQHSPTLKNPLELHDLRWLDVPLDIYRLVVEQCSVKTLYNLCLVSKLSREFATPILYRCVDLVLRSTGGLACLRHLIRSTSAKYCEELRLDLDGYWDEPEPNEGSQLLDSAIMCLVEFAIGRMPNLKTFSWEGTTFPDDALRCALQKRPNLVNVLLTSLEPIALEQPKLGVGAFAHLKCLRVKGIASTEEIHEVRHAVENSPVLEILHLEGCDALFGLDIRLPLFGLLLCPRLSGEGGLGGEGRALLGRSLKQISFGNFVEYDPTHVTEGSSFSDIAPFAFGHLDCLTLYGIESRLLNDIGICTGLRLRKLRVWCDSWRPLAELLSCSELELLHIFLEQAGFDYNSLIPLVCKSKEKLRELRVEERDTLLGPTTDPEPETLSYMMACELVVKCLHLQHLSLRADFATGVWNNLCNLFAVSLSDLVSFRLETAEPRSLPGYSSWRYLDRYRLVWENAQEFATAFVRAAKTAAHEEGKSVADEDIRVNLKYVGIDGRYSEIWMRENKYVISDLSDKRDWMIQGVFRWNSSEDYATLFRVSQTD